MFHSVLGVSTAVFGTFTKFGKNSHIMAIRHVLRPTISINYKPDLAAKRLLYHADRQDRHDAKVPLFISEGIYPGAFSEGKFGGMGFGIDNNLEMKVRSKTDTAKAGIKKVRLIDGFSINGSYNFFADSFKLSQFSLSVRSTLFDKINITGQACLIRTRWMQQGFRNR